MYIDNNLKEAKKELLKLYKLKLSNCSKENKKRVKEKYCHMNHCLQILMKGNYKKYNEYKIAVYMHDIGRFINTDDREDDNHAKKGYDYLLKNFTTDPIVLLSIKYHESDLSWEDDLLNDNYFINCNKAQKKLIKECCEYVREIDIISNMIKILKKTSLKKVDEINLELINKFLNNNIGSVHDVNNEYDQIMYIICGLNLIKLDISFEYLKKKKIVRKLLKKLLFKVRKNKIFIDKTLLVNKKLEKEFGV